MDRVIVKACFLIMLSLLMFSCEKRDIRGEPVEYTSGNVVLKGYLAYDKEKNLKRPGILVVHEWWGLNDYSRKRAKMLARLGYTALAVDMFGEGRQAENPEEAGKLAKEISGDLDKEMSRFVAAMEFLKKHESVDPDRIAAIGYCFGGSVALEMARSGLDLKGVVSFHGGLSTAHPAQPGGVKAKILVCQGEKDSIATPQQVEEFKNEMTAAGADFKIITYKDAMHSFTNPRADSYASQFNLPVGYNKEADQKSWNDMKKFLSTIFSKTG